MRNLVLTFSWCALTHKWEVIAIGTLLSLALGNGPWPFRLSDETPIIYAHSIDFYIFSLEKLIMLITVHSKYPSASLKEQIKETARSVFKYDALSAGSPKK